jgi:hypothetical protein
MPQADGSEIVCVRNQCRVAMQRALELHRHRRGKASACMTKLFGRQFFFVFFVCFFCLFFLFFLKMQECLESPGESTEKPTCEKCEVGGAICVCVCSFSLSQSTTCELVETIFCFFDLN